MRKNKYIPRIQRVLQTVRADPSSVDNLAKTLDQLIATKQLPTEEQALNSLISSKAIIPDPYSDPVPNIPAPGGNGTSKLAVRTNPNYLAYAANFSMLNQFVQYSQEGIRNQYKNIPPFGDPSRDFMLSQVWRHEPILAGAIYSMCAKQSSLKWSVTGRRLPAKRLAVLLAGAAFIDGYDWGGFMSGTAEDFFSTNRGFFWETPRLGDPVFGQLSDLGHIDALCCTLTGSKVTPMIYTSAATGQVIHFGPGEYNHAASLPSARELHLGAGFCAVDRALRAAILLMGLHDYDSEKLSNLPPEGVAAVTGLTKDELQDALTLWLAERKKNSSLTFPQVLWLVASQPNASVDVKMVSFSQLPEQFDRKTVIEQYVNTLSLAFGVDAREFWSLSGGGLGSAGESSIQHMKARGKGGSELTTIVERKINGEAPEDTFFGIDDPDVQAIADEAKVAKAWVDAYLPLYNLRPAGGPTQFGGGVVKANPTPENRDGSGNSPTSPILGLADTGGNMSSQAGGAKLAEQVITKDELLRLLIDHGVLPDWMVDDQRTAVGDSEVHQRRILSQKEGHDQDYTKFVWQKGALTEERLPPIVLRGVAYFEPFEPAPVVMADVLDEETQAKSVLNYLHLKASQILDAQRNIHGKPIPEAEVTRGSNVNRKTIHDELERWRKDPRLAPYALSAEEEQQFFGAFKSVDKIYPVEVVKVAAPESDKVEVALKDLQNSIQHLSESNDNRLNVSLERLLTVLAESQSKQSNVRFDIPPITVVVPEQKPPVVNITMPEQHTSPIEINMPEQKDYPQPNFTFSPQIDMPTPIVNVNVPPSQVTVENNVPVPEVTVNNNIPVPSVNVDNKVNMPEEGTETIVVHRGEDGKIDSMTKV